MAKYDVSATVTIEAHVESDGDVSLNEIGVEDFDSGSFYGNETVEDSTEITFVYETETDDQDEVYSEVQDFLSNNLSYEKGYSDLEWEVTDVSVDSVEKQETEMTLDEAKTLLKEFLGGYLSDNEKVKEAIVVLLDAIG